MTRTTRRLALFSPDALGWVAAALVTAPFLAALPSHLDLQRPFRALALLAFVAGVLLAVRLAARRLARHGAGATVVAFAVLYLLLGALGYAAVPEYRLGHAIADFGLLYLAFFAAALASRLAPIAGRLTLALLASGLVSAAIVQAVHMRHYGFAIAAEGYRAILQSNTAEAWEFVRQFFGAGTVAMAVATLALVVMAGLAVPAVRASGRALLAGALCAAVALPILAGYGERVGARLEPFSQALAYGRELMAYRALLEARRSKLEGIGVRVEGPLADQPQTLVFVIGESLTRNHMSLYGYWRNTTPELDRLEPELAVFRDVVSPHSHTEESLELALTLANHANQLRFTDPDNFSLIEILRAAGFETWWISNQNSSGPWDNKTSVLASAADHVRYAETRSGPFVSGPPDEVLLAPLAAALRHSAPRKAIFLHVLGSHSLYANRYPPEAAVFRELPDEAQIGARISKDPRLGRVDPYDNSVRYHDGVVARIIELVRGGGGAAAVILFADHGENIYGFRAHYWTQFTRDHVEVPFLFWLSPDSRRLAPDMLARSRAAAALPFSLEDLPHLVADLAGLRALALRDERSPLSPRYRVPKGRFLFGGAFTYEEADEPILNMRRSLRRIAGERPELGKAIWAHRVNTLGKMQEAAPLFAGVEMDVVFDAKENRFLVNHPPAPRSGLTLDEALAYANRLNPALSFWLDVKNLDEANAAAALRELERLDARHAIRDRALVETGHTGPAAALLRDAGFRSSYYLPTALVTSAAGGGHDPDCAGAAEIERVVAAGRFAAISYDWRGRPWVERCLGPFVRDRGLQTFTWDLAIRLTDRRASQISSDTLDRYASHSAVLLPFRSLFDDVR